MTDPVLTHLQMLQPQKARYYSHEWSTRERNRLRNWLRGQKGFHDWRHDHNVGQDLTKAQLIAAIKALDLETHAEREIKWVRAGL
jgi:hypothetical protein